MERNQKGQVKKLKQEKMVKVSNKEDQMAIDDTKNTMLLALLFIVLVLIICIVF